MKIFSFYFTFALLVIFHSPAIAQERGGLEEVQTFAFGLGLEPTENEIELLKQYDLVVVDGTNVSAEQLASIKENGALVLGYVSAGTIEEGRSWSKKLKKKFALAYWEDWDEWFAEVSKRRFQTFFIKKICQPVLNKGFDGLFLDNVDMISEFPKQTKGMKRLLKKTRKLLGDDKFLFIQNGDDIIAKIESVVRFDGWNREDVTSTYNFDSEDYEAVSDQDRNDALAFLQTMKQKGYLITATDYTTANDSTIALESISNACAAGALPFVSDINLTRLPAEPFQCQ